MQEKSRAERVLAAVRNEQERQGVSDQELARRLGLMPEYLAGRFTGKKGLTGSELGHIADALAVPAAQLLHLAGE